MCVKVLLFVVAFCLVVGLGGGNAVADDKDGDKRKQLEKILTTKELWGKDFPQLLTRLKGWGEAGEERVAVFPNRVVGTTPYRKAELAEAKVERLATGMRSLQKDFTPAITPLIQGVTDDMPRRFKPQVIQSFADDDSARLAWVPEAGEAAAPVFIPKGLKVTDVYEKIGKPERVTTRVVQPERGGRRPTVLKLHEYAAGEVAFVESDLSPRPGTVDRVILAIKPVSTTISGKKE